MNDALYITQSDLAKRWGYKTSSAITRLRQRTPFFPEPLPLPGWPRYLIKDVEKFERRGEHLIRQRRHFSSHLTRVS